MPALIEHNGVRYTLLEAFNASVPMDNGTQPVDGTFVKMPGALYHNIPEMTRSDIAYVTLWALLGDPGRGYSGEVIKGIVGEWITPDMAKADGATLEARLNAVLAKYLIDRAVGGADALRNVVVCSASHFSVAAVDQFKQVLGVTPIVLQAAGTLPEGCKQRLSRLLGGQRPCIVKCDESALNTLCHKAVTRIREQHTGTMPLVIARCNVAAVITVIYRCLDALREQGEDIDPLNTIQMLQYDNPVGIEGIVTRIAGLLGLDLKLMHVNSEPVQCTSMPSHKAQAPHNAGNGPTPLQHPTVVAPTTTAIMQCLTQ